MLHPAFAIHWFSPTEVFLHLQNSSGDNLSQAAEEFRSASILAYCLSALNNKWYFVGRPVTDPPDFTLLEFSIDLKPQKIISVEHTAYINSENDLVDQIKLTKNKQSYPLDNIDLLLIHVAKSFNPDYEKLQKELKKTNYPIEILAIQDTSRNGTTFSKTTLIYPDLKFTEVNVGSRALKYDNLDIYSSFKLKASGSAKSGIWEIGSVIDSSKPPWDY